MISFTDSQYSVPVVANVRSVVAEIQAMEQVVLAANRLVWTLANVSFIVYVLDEWPTSAIEWCINLLTRSDRQKH